MIVIGPALPLVHTTQRGEWLAGWAKHEVFEPCRCPQHLTTSWFSPLQAYLHLKWFYFIQCGNRYSGQYVLVGLLLLLLLRLCYVNHQDSRTNNPTPPLGGHDRPCPTLVHTTQRGEWLVGWAKQEVPELCRLFLHLTPSWCSLLSNHLLQS